MIYVLTFIVSVVCCYFSERKFRDGKKTFGVLFATIAIMLPAVVAGLRTTEVGTDVQFYLIRDHQAALSSMDFSGYLDVAYGDPLFIGIVYAISNIFGDINVLMFFLSLITVGVMYFGCTKFKNKAPAYLMFGFFLFVYFNMSLNLIRQSIALSFSFLALSYLFDKKWIKYLVLVAIATLFHMTAIVMLGVLVIYILIPRIKNKIALYLASAAGVGILVLSFGLMLKGLVDVGILGEKYMYYTESGNVDVSLAYIGFSLAALIAAVIRRKNILKNKEGNFLLYVSFLNVLLLGLSLRYNTAERLTYYLGYANVIIVPMIAMSLMQNNRIRKDNLVIDKKAFLILFLYFGGLTAYHLIYYNVLNNHRTYPYRTVIATQNNKGITHHA